MIEKKYLTRNSYNIAAGSASPSKAVLSIFQSFRKNFPPQIFVIAREQQGWGWGRGRSRVTTIF